MGKTTAIAAAALWFLLTTFPVKVVVVASSGQQLNDTLWKELGILVRKMPAAFQAQIEMTTDQIKLKANPDASFIAARTGNREKPEVIQGLHSENLVLFFDEASGIDEIVFEYAMGSMSTPGAKTVLTGNPTRSQGYFFNAFFGSDKLWSKHKVSCSDSPTVDPAYPKEVAASFGENSNVYRVRVLGEFPVSDDDTLLSRELVEAATTRDVVITPMSPVIWGVDVARFGNDRSALAKRRGNTLLEPIKNWRKKDTMETTDLVVAEFFNEHPDFRPQEILVDVIGVGAGVVDALRKKNLPNVDVKGINVSESAASKEQYYQLRDELWYLAKDWFASRDCKIPNDTELVDELITPTYKIIEANGKLKIEAKSDMKKRTRRSPDLADAFCLTFAGRKHLNSFNTIPTADTKWIV